MSDIKFLETLASYFELLPGVGKKTAKRYAYHVVEKLSLEEVEEFSKELIKTKKEVCNCSVCGMLSINNPCGICSNVLRDSSKIMVLKDTKDILSIENMEQYNGLYHSLNGLISLMNGISPDKLNIDSLIKRINSNVKEIIIATPYTIDGETTALYLTNLLKNYNVETSRISTGIPAGGDIEYIDELTLKRAIENRIKNGGK